MVVKRKYVCAVASIALGVVVGMAAHAQVASDEAEAGRSVTLAGLP